MHNRLNINSCQLLKGTVLQFSHAKKYCILNLKMATCLFKELVKQKMRKGKDDGS